MAIGNAGVKLAQQRVSIAFDDVTVMRHGRIDAAYDDASGAAVLAKPEFTIAIDLGQGRAQASVWTCDFSYDYVKINAEYRT